MRFQRFPLLTGFLLVLAVPRADAIVIAGIGPNSSYTSPNGSVWDGSSLTGVVFFVGNNSTCSGTLFEPTLTYVLTAAHCVAGLQAAINTNSAYISWQNNGGDNRLVQSFTVDPNYSSTTYSDDIAILKLASPAPSTFAYYPIYTGSSELGQNFTLAGYGDSGTGATGIDPNYSYTQHILRQGQNTFDGIGSTDLYYDFDNGTQQNNAFAGTNTGVRDASGNLVEAMIAPGDSGGPSFINVNGQLEIAGIHSFTGCFSNAQGACSVPPAVSTSFELQLWRLCRGHPSFAVYGFHRQLRGRQRA